MFYMLYALCSMLCPNLNLAFLYLTSPNLPLPYFQDNHREKKPLAELMAREYKGQPSVAEDVLRWNIDRLLQIPEVVFFLICYLTSFVCSYCTIMS